MAKSIVPVINLLSRGNNKSSGLERHRQHRIMAVNNTGFELSTRELVDNFVSVRLQL